MDFSFQLENEVIMYVSLEAEDWEVREKVSFIDSLGELIPGKRLIGFAHMVTRRAFSL